MNVTSPRISEVRAAISQEPTLVVTVTASLASLKSDLKLSCEAGTRVLDQPLYLALDPTLAQLLGCAVSTAFVIGIKRFLVTDTRGGSIGPLWRFGVVSVGVGWCVRWRFRVCCGCAWLLVWLVGLFVCWLVGWLVGLLVGCVVVCVCVV